MNDRPTPTELVDAVRHYLEAELIPVLADARLRFQALVAANVLTIVERQLQTEEAHLLEEWKSLQEREPPPVRLDELRAGVHAANQELCARIRSGEFDAPDKFRELAGQQRRTVVRKLEVSNPRYLAQVSGKRA